MTLVCVAKHRVLIYRYLSACLPADHIGTHSKYLCAKGTLHHHLSKIPALWAFCAAVTLKPWDKLYFHFSTQTQPDWAKYTSQLICSRRQIIRKYRPYLSLSLSLSFSTSLLVKFAAIQMTPFHACKTKLVFSSLRCIVWGRRGGYSRTQACFARLNAFTQPLSLQAGEAASARDTWVFVVVLCSLATRRPEAESRLDIYLLSTQYGRDRNPMGAV